ncbi:hypothetical protein SAMN05216276_100155 [Streptosporangium subroseum]|uniref:26 kDa periplasmic immunogenic protein n=1 Tax=Streptosporangium subroseum TaxID=106412 RepID=A0A239A1K2_9ACTN|nr:SIMPL domain-containing protein [Streptosporangium subroseum]SNR89272.1 hypothetical protein SAMN05216276_100155 [Streptosporangium subroseum]
MIKISHAVAVTLLASMGSLGLFGGTAFADPETTRAVPEEPASCCAKPQITIRGEGIFAATPDVMRLNAGVEVRRPTAGAAFTEARKVAATLTQVLIAAGIAAKDLRTNQLSLGPEYETYPKVSGYRAAQGVEAVVRDIESADRVVDAVAAVGEDVRLNGLSFEVSDTRAALEAARDAAFKDARARARQYAKLAGRALGRALTINEENVVRNPPAMAGAMFAEKSSISPGQQNISVDVLVSYELK